MRESLLFIIYKTPKNQARSLKMDYILSVELERKILQRAFYSEIPCIALRFFCSVDHFSEGGINANH